MTESYACARFLIVKMNFSIRLEEWWCCCFQYWVRIISNAIVWMLRFYKCLKRIICYVFGEMKRDLHQTSGYTVMGLDPPAGHAVLLLSFVMHHAAILNNLR